VIERRANRVELRLQVSDADSENQPSVRQHVGRGEFLGEHHRVSLRQYDDAGAKPNLRRMRRDERQRDRRIEHRVVGRHRRRRRLRVGQYHMLARPHAFEPRIFGRARDGGSAFGKRTRSVIDSE
jgi:hypothetical protein